MKERIKRFVFLFAFLLVMVIVLIFFHDYLNANSNALLVLITFVYVIATVEICRANIKSAEATRDQLAESKRQYEDNKRIVIMPYIQFEQTKDSADHELNLLLDSGDNPIGKYHLWVRMKNIGNGTAKDIAYAYQWDNFAKIYDRGAFPVQALSSGESQTIKIDFAYTTDDKNDRNACFLLRYRDLLENDYTQQLNLRFKQNNSATLKLIEFTTSAPVLNKKVATHA